MKGYFIRPVYGQSTVKKTLIFGVCQLCGEVFVMSMFCLLAFERFWAVCCAFKYKFRRFDGKQIQWMD